jgi:hypothetical protein
MFIEKTRVVWSLQTIQGGPKNTSYFHHLGTPTPPMPVDGESFGKKQDVKISTFDPVFSSRAYFEIRSDIWPFCPLQKRALW